MNPIIFVLLIIPILVLNYYAYKKNSIKLLIISILFFSLIIGLRGINVGIDTSSYYEAFENNFPKPWLFKEAGFKTISILLMQITNNATIVMTIYALVTNFLIMLRFWAMRDKTNFAISSTLYILVFMFSTMNIMRQFLAIAIVFYFSKFLENKKYLLFIMAVIAATLIHRTALVTIFLLVPYIWNSLSSKQKIVSSIPLIGISALTIIIVTSYEKSQIENYLSTDRLAATISLVFVYRIIIYIVSVILRKTNISITYGHRKIDTDYTKYKNEYKELTNTTSLIYFSGLCLSSLGMLYGYVARIGLYFLIFEPLYWGILTKEHSKNASLNLLMIMIFAIYVFARELILNGSGVFPYYIQTI